MKFVLPFWLALAILLASGNTALATDSVGEAAAVSGTVALERNGQRTRLTSGTPIFNGDIIHTAPTGASVRLLLRDDSVLSLGQNSRFLVENFSTGDNSRTARFRLAFGRVRASISQTFSDVSDVQIRTPTAVAGVRGTQFVVDYDAQARQTTVSVLSGRVDFLALDRVADVVHLGPRQRSRQAPGTGASPAEDLTAEDLGELQEAVDTDAAPTPQGQESGPAESDIDPDSVTEGDPSVEGLDGSDQETDEETTLDDSLNRGHELSQEPAPDVMQQLPTENPAGDQPTGVRVRW